MTKINYEDLVDEYNQNLSSVLRGFRPKYDFLELWVPDSDPMESILNLVESAQSFGVADIGLQITNETAEGIDWNLIQKEAKAMGNMDVTQSGNGYLVQFSNLVEGESERHSRDLAGAIEEAPDVYKERIKELYNSITFEGAVQEDDELLLIRSTQDGISLFAAMDTKNHRIKHATFGGAANDIEKALLEGLCRIIEGTPIQEASDHGVIKLESMLRESGQKPVSGIVNIFNLDPIFNLPLNLVRDLLKTYREKSGYNDLKNFWDGRPSADWKQSSPEERMKKAQETIGAAAPRLGLEGVSVEVTNVDKGVKVYVAMGDELSSKRKAKVLMDLERELRNKVEPKIELYQEPWKDKSKLRRL